MFLRYLVLYRYNLRQNKVHLYLAHTRQNAITLVKQYVENGANAIMGNHEKCAIVDIESGSPKWSYWSDFLKNLPLFIERPPYIFVHAGIRTGIPLHEQHEEDLLTIREPFFSENIQEDATIIFGHTPTHRLDVPVGMLWEKAKKIGIDTGAGINHYLSLVDLTNRTHYRVPVLNPVIQQVEVFQF